MDEGYVKTAEGEVRMVYQNVPVVEFSVDAPGMEEHRMRYGFDFERDECVSVTWNADSVIPLAMLIFNPAEVSRPRWGRYEPAGGTQPDGRTVTGMEAAAEKV